MKLKQSFSWTNKWDKTKWVAERIPLMFHLISEKNIFKATSKWMESLITQTNAGHKLTFGILNVIDVHSNQSDNLVQNCQKHSLPYCVTCFF